METNNIQELIDEALMLDKIGTQGAWMVIRSQKDRTVAVVQTVKKSITDEIFFDDAEIIGRYRSLCPLMAGELRKLQIAYDDLHAENARLRSALEKISRGHKLHDFQECMQIACAVLEGK